jgi:hypothetical protein
VIDRFATVAAACRMAIEAELLPWKSEDTDADIEACVTRWAGGWIEYDETVDSDDSTSTNTDTIVAAIITFMSERQTWEGTAAQLLVELNGVGGSAKSLGHALKKNEKLRRLKAAHIAISKDRDKTPKRNKIIRIERAEPQLQ